MAQSKLSSRKKREMGRPSKLYPPRVDATVDELVSKMFSLTPEQSESIRKSETQTGYRCRECERLVHYPAILYEGDLCESCHRSAS